MSNTKLELGDLVENLEDWISVETRKSTKGARLLVVAALDSGYYEVLWFTGDPPQVSKTKIKTGMYHVDSLKLLQKAYIKIPFGDIVQDWLYRLDHYPEAKELKEILLAGPPKITPKESYKAILERYRICK